METKKATDGFLGFAETIAPLFARALTATGGATCNLTASLVTNTAAATDMITVDEDQCVLAVRFEGALSGHCSLVCSAEHATLLANVPTEESIDAKALLSRAVLAACEPLAAALSAKYGNVRVHAAEPAAEMAPESDTAVVAWLLATAPSGVALRVGLSADGELQRGITRLARVAVAAEAAGITSGNLGLVMDVELNVTLRFGQRQLSLREVMDLASGSVVELDREVDEPVDLILDGRVIARGEAVIIDGNYGVRVTEVLQPVLF